MRPYRPLQHVRDDRPADVKRAIQVDALNLPPHVERIVRERSIDPGYSRAIDQQVDSAQLHGRGLGAALNLSVVRDIDHSRRNRPMRVKPLPGRVEIALADIPD